MHFGNMQTIDSNFVSLYLLKGLEIQYFAVIILQIIIKYEQSNKRTTSNQGECLHSGMIVTFDDERVVRRGCGSCKKDVGQESVLSR